MTTNPKARCPECFNFEAYCSCHLDAVDFPEGEGVLIAVVGDVDGVPIERINYAVREGIIGALAQDVVDEAERILLEVD